MNESLPHPISPPAHGAGFGRILVGVCTYNEASNIIEVLDRIELALPSADVVVVDDDSPDGTAALAESHPSTETRRVDVVVRHGQRGLGGAIRVAMNHAIRQGYDYFCNLDADLSHDPSELPLLVAALIENPSIDVAIGSRYVGGGQVVGWPLRRRIMSRVINTVSRTLIRLPVRDASGSFRCYRVSELAKVDLDASSSDGFAFLQQVLLRLHRQDARMVEVPITFIEREHGQSKLGPREAIRSSVTILKLLGRQ